MKLNTRQIIEKWGYLAEVHGPENDLDQSLVLAVIEQESAGDPAARSNCPAWGLMQLTTPACSDYDRLNHVVTNVPEELLIPEVNVRIGCWYLRWVLQRVGNDVFKALRAYNVGVGTIKRDAEAGVKYATRVLERQQNIELILQGEKT